MSFLGIGVHPPQASLGSMLNDSQTYLSSAPWYALGTGGAIVVLILGVSLFQRGPSAGQSPGLRRRAYGKLIGRARPARAL